MLLKGRCQINVEVTKVRSDTEKNQLTQDYYENAEVDEHTDDQGVFHGNGGEEGLEVELNDGVYTEERLASPGPRQGREIDIQSLNKHLDVDFGDDNEIQKPVIKVKEQRDSSAIQIKQMQFDGDFASGFNLTEVPVSKNQLSPREMSKLGLK